MSPQEHSTTGGDMKMWNVKEFYHAWRAYVDTIAIVLTRRLSSDDFQQLIQLCSRFNTKRSEYLKDRGLFRIQLNRPSRKTIRFLMGLEQRYDFWVNRIDIAFDFLTKTEFDAEILKRLIDTHLIKKWSRDTEVTWKRNTRYSGTKKWGSSEVAAYEDKPSKMTGEPCCHVELRFKGKRCVRRLKIERMENVLHLKSRKIWDRWIKMCKFGLVRLGKLARQHGLDNGRGMKRVSLFNLGVWIALKAAREARDRNPSAQAVAIFWKEAGLRPDRVLLPMKIDMLPPRKAQSKLVEFLPAQKNNLNHKSPSIYRTEMTLSGSLATYSTVRGGIREGIISLRGEIGSKQGVRKGVSTRERQWGYRRQR